jgi:transcription elongation GreA/GreB family factor
MALGAAIINAIERDSAEGGPNRALRLRNLLVDDKELAPDLVTGITELEARPFAKSLYDSSVLPDLDRNLLLANMMKVHPSLQEVVLARVQVKEKQNLYVSLRSFAARKAEYEDIVNVKIPKNKHDLEITRAEGDLRENGGYQDAKATRQVLMRRSEELSRLLSQAEPTDFSGATCEQTGMGTQVTFVSAKGQEVVYTILGAWDSIPEQGVIPYTSKLGARLIGHKVGDSVRLPLEIGGAQVKMTVKAIDPAPKSLIYPDAEV